MPLLQPGPELEEAGEKRNEPIGQQVGVRIDARQLRVSAAIRMVREAASGARADCAALVTTLRDKARALGVDIDAAPRGQTALAVHELVTAIDAAPPEATLERLGHRENRLVRSGNGLQQRFSSVASALSAALRGGEPQMLREAAARLAEVGQHVLFPWHRERVGPFQMALRLARWLQTPPSPARSFEEAVDAYVTSGSFVDWTRSTPRGGDEADVVTRTFDEVVQAVVDRREEDNRAFAALLSAWTAAAPTSGLLGIEHVLARVVAPLTRRAPVLLIVLDGMSLPVARELFRGGVRRWLGRDCTAGSHLLRELAWALDIHPHGLGHGDQHAHGVLRPDARALHRAGRTAREGRRRAGDGAPGAHRPKTTRSCRAR